MYNVGANPCGRPTIKKMEMDPRIKSEDDRKKRKINENISLELWKFFDKI